MLQPWEVLPAQFIDRLRSMFPEAEVAEILASFCQKRPTTLRANTLKISGPDLQKELAQDGIELEPISWWEHAFILKNVTLRELEEHRFYKEGFLYVQSLSSMIPPLVLQPQPNDLILDLTAAPGSKTTQMAALMQNLGEIVANDTSLVRLFKLQANLEIQGVTNTRTLRGQGQDLWKRYPEYFDRSLVDVPCSMEGRFNCAAPKTYENWNPKKNKELSLRQRALLRSAVSATKPGGVIVYSTCTLSVEENEAVIDWLLKKEQGAVVVEPVELPGIPAASSLKTWKHKVFDPQIAQTVRILPSSLMEGFYVAKLRKVHTTLIR